MISAALAVWAWQRQALPQAAAPVRFSVAPPPDTEFTFSYFGLAISPDGRQLAFAALKKDATAPTLWLRPMDSLDARELPGTENANGVFWSPDSKSIGFHADNKLKRIDLAGGSARTLCDAPGFEGGSWNSAGLILFGTASGGLGYLLWLRDHLPVEHRPATVIRIFFRTAADSFTRSPGQRI